MIPKYSMVVLPRQNPRTDNVQIPGCSSVLSVGSAPSHGIPSHRSELVTDQIKALLSGTLPGETCPQAASHSSTWSGKYASFIPAGNPVLVFSISPKPKP